MSVTRKFSAAVVMLAVLLNLAFAASSLSEVGDIANENMMELALLLRGILTPLAIGLLVFAGAVYAVGQALDEETRKKARSYAYGIVIGAIVGLIIAILAPFVICMFFEPIGECSLNYLTPNGNAGGSGSGGSGSGGSGGYFPPAPTPGGSGSGTPVSGGGGVDFKNPSTGPGSASSWENPKQGFSDYSNYSQVYYYASAPTGALPVTQAEIENYDSVATALGMSEQQKSMLSENGFVVIPYPWGEESDFVDAYRTVRQSGVPVFVTSDASLHLYHIQFSDLLMQVEENNFSSTIKQISDAMMVESQEQYNSARDERVKEAARKNIAFFCVARRLLDPNAQIPGYVQADVASELELINNATGFANSPIFYYEEDYSQYKPRGHYTRSQALERYFKAMMWYGRMSFLIQEGLVTQEQADEQTTQAILASLAMDSATLPKHSDITAREAWMELYSITSFFVGTSDDLTPYEYRQAVQSAYPPVITEQVLTDGTYLFEFRSEIAQMRLPEIYGGTGFCEIPPPFSPEQLDECLNNSKGMRFMGQRYVPDSYMFQNLVFPAAGQYTGSSTAFTTCTTIAGKQRCFPRGLDVMSVLGSERAQEIIAEEGDASYWHYATQRDSLREEFANLSQDDWNKNLYFAWLFSMKPLLEERDNTYPAFMQSEAWSDKSLQTTLASWTELRHDTILYAKQSYTPFASSAPLYQYSGYIEPQPEFNNRVLYLTRMTSTGLEAFGLLNDSQKRRLESMQDIQAQLLNISLKELNGTELSQEEQDFITYFDQQLELAVTGVDEDSQNTTLVADVHTDQNTGQVLEEGTGYLDLMVVAYRQPDGTTVLGAGPVMSYYEFKQPLSSRLTDEEWVSMLATSPPERPAWTSSFRSE